MPKKGYRVPRGRPKGQGRYIPIGKYPADPKMAWHFLSRQAKQKLAEMRQQGHFGGEVGEAPYWGVQERGDASVGIEPLHFVKLAMEIWDTTIDEKIYRFLRG